MIAVWSVLGGDGYGEGSGRQYGYENFGEPVGYTVFGACYRNLAPSTCSLRYTV